MAPRHAALFTHLHADVLICLHSEIVIPCSQLDLSLHSMKIDKKNLTFWKPVWSQRYTWRKKCHNAFDNEKIYSTFVITVSSNLNEVDTFPQARFFVLWINKKVIRHFETKNFVLGAIMNVLLTREYSKRRFKAFQLVNNFKAHLRLPV